MSGLTATTAASDKSGPETVSGQGAGQRSAGGGADAGQTSVRARLSQSPA